jgi:predicted oxidoreductase
MQTQFLGTTQLEVSSLAYGAMRLPGTWNPAEVIGDRIEQGKRALRAAYESGYTLFDHADIYCYGKCEEIHGLLLKESPELRKQTVIATKCGIRFPNDPVDGSPHRYDFSKEHIIWSCEQSLKRLQVDAIDIYQLHRPDYLMDPIEVAEAFDILHAQGKVRYFGVSNFAPSKVAALQSALGFPLIVNQVEIHLKRLDRFEDGTLDQCLELDITPLSYSPLAGGSLGAGREVAPEDKALIELMDSLAAEFGVTRTEIAVSWLLQHPAGIIPIIGSVNSANIKQAVKACAVDLGRENWYRLMVAARGERLP